ncbi:hypothetical protein L208DRAFT_1434547 [Tricholoma matsutake]|nr:hypothetical protein L208DRAFT_1434547 [Tricholoma matsutake 945]
MHRVTSLSSRADNSGNFISGTGSLFIAYLLSWGLYGVLCVQAYIYYLAFPNDRRLHKWLVYSVYFLETVDTVFLTYDALADFRNVFGLSVPVSSRNTSSPVQFSWLRMYIFGGIVTCIVQFYYACHLHYLRRSRIFTFAILLSTLTQCLAGFVAGIVQSKYNFHATATQTKISAEVYTFGITSAVCSILVSFLMVHQLLWRDTDWKGRHPFIPKIVRLSIETGMIAALAAVVYVVLFFCHVDPLVLMLPALLLGKIYSNSFLLVLNSRMNIAEGRVLPTGQSESSTFAGSMLGSVVIGVQVKHVDVAVQVTRHIEVDRSMP